MTEKNESTGTARLLHELTEFDKLKDDYGNDVAVAVTTTAIQRKFPQVTKTDVQSCIKVSNILMSGNIDIASEHKHLNDKAEKVSQEVITNLLNLEKEDA